MFYPYNTLKFVPPLNVELSARVEGGFKIEPGPEALEGRSTMNGRRQHGRRSPQS